MELCLKCGYPVSKSVNFLMALKVRLNPGPAMHICEGCGIYDSEREKLGHGNPEGLIALMEEEGFDDWWYMNYKFANVQTIDLFEPPVADAGGGE